MSKLWFMSTPPVLSFRQDQWNITVHKVGAPPAPRAPQFPGFSAEANNAAEKTFWNAITRTLGDHDVYVATMEWGNPISEPTFFVAFNRTQNICIYKSNSKGLYYRFSRGLLETPAPTINGYRRTIYKADAVRIKVQFNKLFAPQVETSNSTVKDDNGKFIIGTIDGQTVSFSNTPRVHESYQQVTDEAERLARSNPSKTFIVAKLIEQVTVNEVVKKPL